MRIVSSTERLNEPVVVTIGNFDGVHLGHQYIIKRLRQLAAAEGLRAAVLSFEPHPLKVLAPERAPRLIQTPEEKVALLKRQGVDFFLRQPFNERVASMTPRAFIEELHGRAPFHAVVVGSRFRFGHKRSGSVATLKELGAELGFRVEGLPEETERDAAISSTRVRKHLLNGRVDLAGELLGRPYFLSGPVVMGDRRGRELDAPTANIAAANELLPKKGVYATWSRFDGQWRRSITNVGVRPSLQGTELRVESHLFDFSGNLYDKRLLVCFHAFLREEQPFPGLPALKRQIHRDFVERLSLDDEHPPDFELFDA